MTTTGAPLPQIGQRVIVTHWGVATFPVGGTKDTDTGLIRDANGEVVTIDDNVTVPPGTKGTVDYIDGANQIHVKWDNGCRLALLDGADEWTVES